MLKEKLKGIIPRIKEVREEVGRKGLAYTLKMLLRTKVGLAFTTGLIVFIIVGTYSSISKSALNNELTRKDSEIKMLEEAGEQIKLEHEKEIKDINRELQNARISLNTKDSKLKEVDIYFKLVEADQELASNYMNELKNKTDEEKKAEQERIKVEEQARKQAEEEAKAKAEAEEKAKKEAEEQARLEAERNKYNTGLTYEDLARNPIDNALKLVTFKGKIIQVMKGDGYTQYRMAIDSNYDKVVLIEIKNSLLTKGNILEDDIITVRGKFVMEQTYTTVMGAERTIPAIVADEVDY